MEHLLWEYDRVKTDHKWKGGLKEATISCSLEDLEAAIVSCLLSFTLFPNPYHYYDYDWCIRGAWRILVAHVVVGKLKKDLLHPSLLACLSRVIEYEEEPFHTTSFETHLQRFLGNTTGIIVGLTWKPEGGCTFSNSYLPEIAGNLWKEFESWAQKHWILEPRFLLLYFDWAPKYFDWTPNDLSLLILLIKM